jgi:hypothetical protein
MLPETKGWPQKRAGWERQWHQKPFGVPTSCDGRVSTKLPNSWTARWRSPADSVPVAAFRRCSDLPTEHLDIWRGLGRSFDIPPYPSRTALQALTSIVDCPRKLSSCSTSPGHKAHSTSKYLPSRCTTPPHNEDHSSWLESVRRWMVVCCGVWPDCSCKYGQ